MFDACVWNIILDKVNREDADNLRMVVDDPSFQEAYRYRHEELYMYRNTVLDVMRDEFEKHNASSPAGDITTGRAMSWDILPAYTLDAERGQFEYTPSARKGWKENMPVRTKLVVSTNNCVSPIIDVEWDIGRPIYKLDVAPRPYGLSFELDSTLVKQHQFDTPSQYWSYNELNLRWEVSITEPSKGMLRLRADAFYREDLDYNLQIYDRDSHETGFGFALDGMYDPSYGTVMWKDRDGLLMDDDVVFNDGVLYCAFPLEAITQMIIA